MGTPRCMSQVAAVWRNVCGTILPPSDDKPATSTARENAGPQPNYTASAHQPVNSVRDKRDFLDGVEAPRSPCVHRAFKRTGDPSLGSFADATVLKTFGHVPKNLDEL